MAPTSKRQARPPGVRYVDSRGRTVSALSRAWGFQFVGPKGGKRGKPIQFPTRRAKERLDYIATIQFQEQRESRLRSLRSTIKARQRRSDELRARARRSRKPEKIESLLAEARRLGIEARELQSEAMDLGARLERESIRASKQEGKTQPPKEVFSKKWRRKRYLRAHTFTIKPLPFDESDLEQKISILAPIIKSDFLRIFRKRNSYPYTRQNPKNYLLFTIRILYKDKYLGPGGISGVGVRSAVIQRESGMTGYKFKNGDEILVARFIPHRERIGRYTYVPGYADSLFSAFIRRFLGDGTGRDTKSARGYFADQFVSGRPQIVGWAIEYAVKVGPEIKSRKEIIRLARENHEKWFPKRDQTQAIRQRIRDKARSGAGLKTTYERQLEQAERNFGLAKKRKKKTAKKAKKKATKKAKKKATKKKAKKKVIRKATTKRRRK